ncbi:cation efflux system protein, putative [Parvularcula bermudensis HTCC2503]|uniref:Cation efflux system protein, putative n=1 Tax=Parvularcula bermudensis (strain ATCC BAA-594 / HTCC2503 / KCTC 12087) TaxID=314260 RepID=E0TI16_PARBH|nr:HlyD family efflux transporter periplasmic adaptor subunit [Parvularcula bermudensis]ADM10827.1 cation efflux system protein, putative [Parvularcula bermudensis HTCC2503]
MSKILSSLLAVTALGAAGSLLSACGGLSDAAPQIGAHGEMAELEAPHGGRLLSEGDFALEMTIFEAGVDPHYRIYPFLGGEPLEPAQVGLTVTLERLDGETNVFSFRPEQDYLMGDGVVTEPHSFVVNVEADYDGETHRWSYDSFEGRTTISDSVAEAAGVVLAEAGPAEIVRTVELLGSVRIAPEAEAEVGAPYAGTVQEVMVTLGDVVDAGQPLARVQNASSLQTYVVRAPFAGTILERRTNPGDVAGTRTMFRLGDLDRLEAELHVFPRDAVRVQPGQSVSIRLAGSDMSVESEIEGFLPMSGAGSQTLIARVPLPGGSGFRPGMRVVGTVVTEARQVPLAVRTEGLQRFRDFTVVFAKIGETYEVRMLDLGERDDDYVEVLGGLKPGTTYAAGNSFLIKADIEKSGASHDH